MTYILSGDALIHCELSGRENAPALVFLHGNGEDLHIFDPQIRFFSQHYLTIAIDTRAHGQSTRGTGPFNFHTFAADLITVLDTLRIEKAHVAGFSDGAITALHAALIAPKRIASMVLIGANYNTEGIRFVPRLHILLMYAWLLIKSIFSAKVHQQREIWGLMVFHPNLTFSEILRIRVPALVITGEKDMVSQEHNDKLSRAIGGRSKRIIIPGGNHFWMFEKPDVLNQCIMEFLKK